MYFLQSWNKIRVLSLYWNSSTMWSRLLLVIRKDKSSSLGNKQSHVFTSISLNLVNLRSIKLCTRLPLDHQNDLHSISLVIKIFRVFLLSVMRTVCLAYLSPFVIAILLFGEKYTLWTTEAKTVIHISIHNVQKKDVNILHRLFFPNMICTFFRISHKL